jgi:hypothetical protein
METIVWQDEIQHQNKIFSAHTLFAGYALGINHRQKLLI